MCVYIHIYIYVLCIYIYIYIYMYVHVCIYIYIFIHVYVYIYIHNMCMYICIYIYIYIYTYYVYIFYVYIYIRMYIMCVFSVNARWVCRENTKFVWWFAWILSWERPSLPRMQTAPEGIEIQQSLDSLVARSAWLAPTRSTLDPKLV